MLELVLNNTQAGGLGGGRALVHEISTALLEFGEFGESVECEEAIVRKPNQI